MLYSFLYMYTMYLIIIILLHILLLCEFLIKTHVLTDPQVGDTVVDA